MLWYWRANCEVDKGLLNWEEMSCEGKWILFRLEVCLKWSPSGKCALTSCFFVYINDLPDNIDSDIYMFVDNIKCFRDISSYKDQEILQQDINKQQFWSKKWHLHSHPEKAKV